MSRHKIIIVGSGFSGICMGIKLKQAGINDFVILEKANELGGTWRENSYPGAECDIPSALYSYSFEPNPNWKHVWSKREQIFHYQKEVAHKYGLMPHFRFSERVNKASYAHQEWRITTSTGQYQAQHFISAIGQLHERFTPDIKGANHFNGAQFHAAKWDHNIDLRGKKVAVFQRTPNWMIIKPNRAYRPLEKWMAKRVTFIAKLYRGFIYLLADGVLYPALNGNKLASWFVKIRVHSNLNKHIKDPELKAKLTPNYAIGAKRILFSHTFYETLNQPHVALNTQRISEITPTTIRTQTGDDTDVDVIIYATGFITNPFFKSIEVKAQGQTLEQAWQQGAHAYLGIYTHGFPNLHMMYGPNTNLGHNSIIIMIEAQADFITRTIIELDRRELSAIDVPNATESAFNVELHTRLNNMVFSQINQSWYMDHGKITNNWAGSTWEYKRRLKNTTWQALGLR